MLGRMLVSKAMTFVLAGAPGATTKAMTSRGSWTWRAPGVRAQLRPPSGLLLASTKGRCAVGVASSKLGACYPRAVSPLAPRGPDAPPSLARRRWPEESTLERKNSSAATPQTVGND